MAVAYFKKLWMILHLPDQVKQTSTLIKLFCWIGFESETSQT